MEIRKINPRGTIPPPKGIGKKPGRKTIDDYDADRLKELVSEGKNNHEIAEELQVAVGTVMKWLKEQGIPTNRRTEIHRIKEKAKEKAENGPNADRHLCETCKFRAEKGKGCDYIIITGKQRGCDPGECNVYDKVE